MHVHRSVIVILVPVLLLLKNSLDGSLLDLLWGWLFGVLLHIGYSHGWRVNSAFHLRGSWMSLRDTAGGWSSGVIPEVWADIGELGKWLLLSDWGWSAVVGVHFFKR